MKRIMLSAATIMFFITGAFANNKSTASSNAAMQRLSREFPGLSSTIPSSVRLTKNFEVDNLTGDDIIPKGYTVLLGGKHFGETAVYNADGLLVSYKEKLKNAQLPSAVESAIMEKHAKAEITKDKEFIKDAKGTTSKLYAVNFKEGKKHYKAVVEENGTIDHMHRQLI